MKINIYDNPKGKPVVAVYGSTKNSAKQVARAYKEAKAELEKKESPVPKSKPKKRVIKAKTTEPGEEGVR